MKIQKKISIFVSVIFLVLFSGKIYADGFIIIERPVRPLSPAVNFSPFLLEVKYHKVDVEISDQVAITKVDQEFYNPTNRRLEGYYLFPVPAGAVIKKFTMYINGKETPAELLDANKARKIFEDIVRKQMDPALLEYQGQELLKVRIFPIESRSTKRVKINYSEIIKKDNGTFEYVYPLNTEKFSSKNLDSVSINVHLKSDDEIKNVFCTSHNTDVVRKKSNDVVVSYEENNVKPQRDFKLYFNTLKSKLGVSLLTFRESKKEKGFFYLDIDPGFNGKENKISAKAITFVLDVSGSMAGEKLDKAKRALNYCIDNLNGKDKFQVISFSTEAEALFNNLVEYNSENKKKAMRFINNMRPLGGTNIDDALSLALKNNDIFMPQMIVFITDGKPTIGETNEKTLVEKVKMGNKKNVRIFTFGIGNEINTHLLDKITLETKAYRTYISPEEDIEMKISNFYTKVQSPVLTDIGIEFSDNIKIYKTYPKEISDLFQGGSITLIGQYSGSGNSVFKINGKIGKKEKSFKYNIFFPGVNNKNETISSIWASRRIGYLLDQIRLNGERKEIVDEITVLARIYGIVTPYTSYLILEDEQIKVSRNEIDYSERTLGRFSSKNKLYDQGKKDFYSMKKKSGMGSVTASEEIQALNQANNYDQTNVGKSRMNFHGSAGTSSNISQQVKKVQGRAFYNANNLWVDSKIQSQKKSKKIRVKFASEEYFKLLKRNKNISQVLSLGKNINFVMDEVIYEIYE